ncbi:hypothetical protein VTI74DRAFT_1981 [Chaetomium olivicolor]
MPSAAAIFAHPRIPPLVAPHLRALIRPAPPPARHRDHGPRTDSADTPSTGPVSTWRAARRARRGPPSAGRGKAVAVVEEKKTSPLMVLVDNAKQLAERRAGPFLPHADHDEVGRDDIGWQEVGEAAGEGADPGRGGRKSGFPGRVKSPFASRQSSSSAIDNSTRSRRCGTGPRLR